MFNLDYIAKEDYITKEDIKEHNSNWAEIPDHTLIGSGSGKVNALLNLISHEPGIDRTYLYAKGSYEAKHQLLINKREQA